MTTASPRKVGSPSAAAPSDRLEAIDLGPVQETMLITLWARAVESQRPDALIRDSVAVEIFKSIDCDFERFAGGWKSQVGVAVRDRAIDRVAGAYIARHPVCRIVNLGAGLDTRCLRLDNGRLHWFDLDLPDAIALRRCFIEEHDRLTFIESSALEFEWMDQVLEFSDRPTLIIAEGVLMFFDKMQVMHLVDGIARQFQGAELVFDLIGPLMVRFPFLHDTLPKTRAKFQWGARSMHEIEYWNHRYETVAVHSMLDECPNRWRWMRWCRYVPALRRQFFLTHLRLCD